MRVIGIDPGSRVTGFGVIDAEGTKLSYVAAGGIHTTSGSFVDRLSEIYRGVAEVIDRYSPDRAVVEDVFQGKNAQSALKLGQARGAAIAALVGAEIEVAEYATRRIKQAVVGTGSATKEQVQYMVRLLLALEMTPSTDASDALAAAICFCHSSSGAVRPLTRRS